MSWSKSSNLNMLILKCLVQPNHGCFCFGKSTLAPNSPYCFYQPCLLSLAHIVLRGAKLLPPSLMFHKVTSRCGKMLLSTKGTPSQTPSCLKASDGLFRTCPSHLMVQRFHHTSQPILSNLYPNQTRGLA